MTESLEEVLACFLKGMYARAVLDMGCGRGKSTASLSKIFPGALVIGVDTDFGKLLEAQENVSASASFVCACASQLPVKEGSLDVATFVLALHELREEDVDLALHEVWSALSDGGTLLILDKVADEPCSPSEKAVVLAEMAYHRAKELALGEKAYGLRKSFELLRQLKRCGFDVVQLRLLSVGKKLSSEEFFRSWGRETRRLMEKLSPKERGEVESLVKCLEKVVREHGYGPARVAAILLEKRSKRT